MFSLKPWLLLLYIFFLHTYIRLQKWIASDAAFKCSLEFRAYEFTNGDFDIVHVHVVLFRINGCYQKTCFVFIYFFGSSTRRHLFVYVYYRLLLTTGLTFIMAAALTCFIDTPPTWKVGTCRKSCKCDIVVIYTYIYIITIFLKGLEGSMNLRGWAAIVRWLSLFRFIVVKIFLFEDLVAHSDFPSCAYDI